MLIIFYLLGLLTASAAAALIALLKRDRSRKNRDSSYDDFLKY